MRCVIGHHNTQCASVDTLNRDNERSQPQRQHNGARDAKVPKRQHNGVRGAKALVGYGGGAAEAPDVGQHNKISSHRRWSHTKELATSWHGRPL
jgi:hypothetical protein